MTRNQGAFGLGLMVAMALCAIAAQGASAVVEHSFRSDSADTILTGANESYGTGNSRHLFTATPGLVIACDATFESTNVGQIRDTVEVFPTFSSCANGVTVHNTGCNFVLDSETTQAAGHSASSEHASVSLDCEHTGTIETTQPGCNIRFEDTHSGEVLVNQSLHGVRYTNLSNHSGKNAGTLTLTVRTIKYTMLPGSFCGLAGHAAGTYNSGFYDGVASVTGYDGGTHTEGTTTWHHGAQTNITVTTPE